MIGSGRAVRTGNPVRSVFRSADKYFFHEPPSWSITEVQSELLYRAVVCCIPPTRSKNSSTGQMTKGIYKLHRNHTWSVISKKKSAGLVKWGLSAKAAVLFATQFDSCPSRNSVFFQKTSFFWGPHGKQVLTHKPISPHNKR